MEKDFDGWNVRKKNINFADRKRLQFSEGEIWFCALGANIGFEQDGVGDKFIRPIAIIKKITTDQFLGIPLTRTIRSGKEYFPLANDHGPSIALLAQIRFLDAKRLLHFSKNMDAESFGRLKEKFIDLIKSYPRPIHRWDICEAGEQADPIDPPRSQKGDPQINNTPDDNIVK